MKGLLGIHAIAVATLAITIGPGCSPKKETPPVPEEAASPPGIPAEVESPSSSGAQQESSAILAAGARLSPWEEARQREVAFRAIGQEPGWLVEIWDSPAAKRIRFVSDSGDSTFEFEAATLEMKTSEARAIYRGESSGRTVEIELGDGPCSDTMSGEVFETKVIVRWGGRTLNGCGRSLR